VPSGVFSKNFQTKIRTSFALTGHYSIAKKFVKTLQERLDNDTKI